MKAKIIEYPVLGITFHCKRSPYFGPWILYYIELDESCQCKTKGGNGIGSTYNDLSREFGELYCGKGDSLAGKTTKIRIRSKNITIEFIDHGWVENDEFETNQITIHGSTDWVI